jgi:hypothetical protein
MHYKNLVKVAVVIALFVSAASAQKAEVTLGLNETFFNALIDSVFANFDPPEFPIAENTNRPSHQKLPSSALGFADAGKPSVCTQSIRILRESGGVRTSVRIRDGKIYLPLAFSGSYSPPFVGCVDFAGWADASLDLEFDREGQRLIGRATVNTVNLNGTGGIGGGVIARLIQNSLDKKMNPIEIVQLDKLSFGVPIQRTGNLRMRAIALRPEILPGTLTLHIDYDFLKG